MEKYPKYVEKYPIEKLKLNDWNPNELDGEMMKKLVRSIKERKFIVPIVANKEGIIVDGEHRYLASKECGLKEVSVILVDMEADDMKLSTLGLNNIRGCDSPIKLAKLLQDLNQRHTLSEISEKIGYGAEELKDKLELLKIPEDMLEKLKEDARKMEAEMPSVMHFAVSKEQEKVILEALESVKGNNNGERLYQICSAYLKQKVKNEK
jgi:ParB/RepB/Spo0J family partition protein